MLLQFPLAVKTSETTSSIQLLATTNKLGAVFVGGGRVQVSAVRDARGGDVGGKRTEIMILGSKPRKSSLAYSLVNRFSGFPSISSTKRAV